MPRTTRIACIVGQSNERGAGSVVDFTPSFGCPMRDPVLPRGSTQRSMWPYLSDLLGRRGTWLEVYNSAVGGTSIAYSWCGRISTWVSSGLVLPGYYALSGGKTWKCTTTSTGGIRASTVTPAAGLQADGITWQDLGSSTGTDTVGVLGPSHARFDPNGYIAAAYAGLSGSTGFDEKWAFISFGQSDNTMFTTAADFSQAIQNVTNYMLDRSVKVAIGFTCYDAEPGAEAYYQSALLPGLALAQATYSGNRNVIAGANLRTALGVLAVEPTSVQISTPALQDDTLHMNDAAYALASEAWRDALVAGGW